MWLSACAFYETQNLEQSHLNTQDLSLRDLSSEPFHFSAVPVGNFPWFLNACAIYHELKLVLAFSLDKLFKDIASLQNARLL